MILRHGAVQVFQDHALCRLSFSPSDFLSSFDGTILGFLLGVPSLPCIYVDVLCANTTLS